MIEEQNRFKLLFFVKVCMGWKSSVAKHPHTFGIKKGIVGVHFNFEELLICI